MSLLIEELEMRLRSHFSHPDYGEVFGRERDRVMFYTAARLLNDPYIHEEGIKETGSTDLDRYTAESYFEGKLGDDIVRGLLTEAFTPVTCKETGERHTLYWSRLRLLHGGAELTGNGDKCWVDDHGDVEGRKTLEELYEQVKEAVKTAA